MKIEITIDEMQMKQLISDWWAESIGRVPVDQIQSIGQEDIHLLLGTENCSVTITRE
jgi:hypothetical protein